MATVRFNVMLVVAEVLVAVTVMGVVPFGVLKLVELLQPESIETTGNKQITNANSRRLRNLDRRRKRIGNDSRHAKNRVVRPRGDI